MHLAMPHHPYDPLPDWTLADLQLELHALSSKLNTPPPLPLHPSPPPHSSCFSWRELSVVADFGRAGRSFRICAFDDESDSEEDAQTESEPEDSADTSSSDGDQAAKDQRSSVSGVPSTAMPYTGPCLLPRTEIVEGSLFELERERLLRVQDEVRQRHLILQTAIEEESNRSAAIFEQVEKDEELRHEKARRTDKQYQRVIAEERDLHISALQRDHEQRSQVEERKIKREAAAEEAQRREKAAREERERQEKLKAEAEIKRKEEALLAEKLAAEAERRRQAEIAGAAALQRAEAEKLAKLQKEQTVKETVTNNTNAVPSASSSDGRLASDPKPIISESAAKIELARNKKMLALLMSSQNFQANPDLKKALKSCERSIIKILQQVSATQEQVRMKSMELMRLLTNPSMQQSFLLTTFASKLMSQCETQVLKLPPFAFPLAQLVVDVGSQIPETMDVVLAKLHEVCIFTIPKYFVFKKSQFENERAYYKALKYNEDGGKLESTDDYIARMNAYVAFYAAITQAEASSGINPHGLKEAWAWCARFVNTAPADRLTASALESFLKVAGFRLYQAYPKAFVRLLQTIVSHFVEKLKSNNDPDARAVVSRLETYVHTHKFLQEPEGRSMPRTDLSSMLKA